MPRGPRLDAAGVQHVMARGIERRHLFQDGHDRQDFLHRIERLVGAGAITIYAWALLPNHFQLSVRTEHKPLGRSIRALLSGYANAFSRCLAPAADGC